MAELTVASGAAGLISLGLQVCSGLVKYFNAYKDHGKDTAAVLRRTRSLQNLLESLVSILRHPSLDGSDVARLVEDEILACAEGIYELERMQKKCTGPGNSAQIGSAAHQLQRAIFLFRKGDLDSLGKTLGYLQDNLKTALLILNTYAPH